VAAIGEFQSRLSEGDGLFASGQFAEARQCYHTALPPVGSPPSQPDPNEPETFPTLLWLGVTHARIAVADSLLDRADSAGDHFERADAALRSVEEAFRGAPAGAVQAAEHLRDQTTKIRTSIAEWHSAARWKGFPPLSMRLCPHGCYSVTGDCEENPPGHC
jgi:hypothetical protein